METYGQQFEAFGEPIRREILERLRRGPLPVGELAQGLPVSRPAVSQHLKVLKEAGLVTETPEGTRRIYRLDPRGIAVMRDWLDEHWSTALAAFAKLADEEFETKEEKPK